MTKVGLIKFLILLLLSVSASAQKKVKYKDIFGLLSTHQYDEAEPFLKSYLRDNDDNPNAYLFMGIIYQEKAMRNDILKQTLLAIQNLDSACYFYELARQTVTERELKRNEEYYQMYSRRDLRTGKFGVKLSDVQFDIEKKVENLRERGDRVKMIKYYFTIADSLYEESRILFVLLQSEFPTERQFFLRAEENELKRLNTLSVRFDSVMTFLENYQSSLQNLTNSGYNQVFKREEITDFKKQGNSKADLYQADVILWDYQKFADHASRVIQKEVAPMKTNLVAYDQELNKLRDKLQHDSVSVTNDLTRLIDKLLAEQLDEFDDDPLPVDIFAMKIADLEYRSEKIEHHAFRDSNNVYLQVKITKDELAQLNKLDSTVSKLQRADLESEIRDYKHFIANTFGDKVVLESYIKSIKEFTDREKSSASKNLAQYSLALQWIVTDADSIPLYIDSVSTSPYKPLMVEQEQYTVGLKYENAANTNGYFCTITPSRIPDVQASFPVDKKAFSEEMFQSLEALAVSANDLIYYIVIYSKAPEKEKYPVTITKIYRSDGLAWSVNNKFQFLPSELAYKQDTGELLVKGGTDQTVVVDKNGVVK